MKNIETTTTSNEKTVSPPAAISVILRSAPWSPFKMWMFQLLMAVVAENPRKPTESHHDISHEWFFLVKFSGQKLIFLFGRITTFKKKIETKICCTKLELTFWES